MSIGIHQKKLPRVQRQRSCRETVGGHNHDKIKSYTRRVGDYKLENNNTNTETWPTDAFSPQALTEQVQGQHCAGSWEETASTHRERHSLERQTCEHEQSELSFRENKVLWELKGRSKQLPSLRSKDSPSVSMENRSQTCSTTTFTWSVLVMAQALRHFHTQVEEGEAVPVKFPPHAGHGYASVLTQVTRCSVTWWKYQGLDMLWDLQEKTANQSDSPGDLNTTDSVKM